MLFRGGHLSAERKIPCLCFYYFFMAVVIITYETKATARWASTFIVRIFVYDTVAITVRASFCFHVAAPDPLFQLASNH